MSQPSVACCAFASPLAGRRELLMAPGTVASVDAVVCLRVDEARSCCAMAREAACVMPGDVLVGEDVWAACSPLTHGGPVTVTMLLHPESALSPPATNADLTVVHVAIPYSLSLALPLLQAVFDPGLAVLLKEQLMGQPLTTRGQLQVIVAGTSMTARITSLQPDVPLHCYAAITTQTALVAVPHFKASEPAPLLLEYRLPVSVPTVLTEQVLMLPASFLKRAMLLVGPAGCGKSTLARHCARAAGCPYAVASLPRLLSEASDLSGLSDLLTSVELAAPSVVVLEDLDVLCHAGHESLQACAEMLAARLETWNRNQQDILTLGTVGSLTGLPRALRGLGAFADTYVLTLPSRAERQAALKQTLLPALGLPSSWAGELAAQTHSYSYADLQSLLRLAVAKNATLNTASVLAQQAWVVQGPAARRQHATRLPVVPWTAFAGYHAIRSAARAVLQEFMLGPVEARHGLSLPSGMLLHGPSGCGKSLLVAALATECTLNVLVAAGPALFGKYVGETEENIRSLFTAARETRPCVLFLDQIEVLTRHRGACLSSTGVEERALSQLLNEMDGIQGADGIFFLACTNRPLTELDAAVVRPGRLEMVFHLGLPTAADRRELIDLLADQWPLDPALNRMTLVASTQGYTGAEVRAAFKTASRSAFRRRAPFIALEDFAS